MDTFVDGLSNGPIWLVAMVTIVYIITTNFDKISPFILGKSTMEKITRDLPELVKRKESLRDAGETRIAQSIDVHIKGVVTPKVKRVMEKEIAREVRRYRSAKARYMLLILFFVYIVVLAVFYFITMSTYVWANNNYAPAMNHPFLAFLFYTFVFVAFLYLLSKLYNFALVRVDMRYNADHSRAFTEWKAEYGVVSINRTKDGPIENEEEQ